MCTTAHLTPFFFLLLLFFSISPYICNVMYSLVLYCVSVVASQMLYIRWCMQTRSNIFLFCSVYATVHASHRAPWTIAHCVFLFVYFCCSMERAKDRLLCLPRMQNARYCTSDRLSGDYIMYVLIQQTIIIQSLLKHICQLAGLLGNINIWKSCCGWVILLCSSVTFIFMIFVVQFLYSMMRSDERSKGGRMIWFSVLLGIFGMSGEEIWYNIYQTQNSRTTS